MSGIIYPETGSWLNSCLVGANSYKVISKEEEYLSAFLEERDEMWLRLADEQRYAVVSSNWDHRQVWMVLFHMEREEFETLADVIEGVQEKGLYRQGIFWPFDLVNQKNTAGYLLRPIDRVRYRPIRTYLGDTKAERWSLAISMFQRVSALHRMGLTLNGFSREQVRVDVENNQICLWPGETASRVGSATVRVCSGDYLSIPMALEKAAIRQLGAIDGRLRDVFSCAALAFYLLYFTHPFIGSAYWPLMREDYWVQYMSRPEYIFDPNGTNRLGYQDFEQEIQRLWERTIPELRELFDRFFMEVSHPCTVTETEREAFLDLDRWIKLLQQDAAVNGVPGKQTDYPFEMMKNYRV